MSQVQEQQQQVSISINDLIYAQVKDLGKRMDRLEHRQDRLEEKLETTRRELNARMDKQDEKIEKLADKIDALDKKVDEKIDRLASKIDTSSNHGQIATITTIGIGLSGVSITLGVLYALIFK